MKSFALFLFLLFTTLAYAGQTVLYTFKGGTDGFWPNGPLVADAAGNFYGTTFYGGDESCNIPTAAAPFLSCRLTDTAGGPRASCTVSRGDRQPTACRRARSR
jgi:hypothetical protein